MKKIIFLISALILIGIVLITLMIFPLNSNDFVEGPLAEVEEVEILILESFPVKVHAIAKGYLPDSCTKIGKIEVAKTIEDNFEIKIWTDVKKDSFCDQAIVPFEQIIDLNVEGFSKGIYNVTINGITESFELQTDNFVAEYWKTDSIHLMQHETDGFFGCFGCSEPGEKIALCIDPSPEMKQVEESPERYCNNDFEIIDVNGNLGMKCTDSFECRTPMEYLVQSNCPFASACIDSKCKVVCPLSFHDQNPEISKSYPVACESDIDCDCSEREARTIECRCIEGFCLSVEAT